MSTLGSGLNQTHQRQVAMRAMAEAKLRARRSYRVAMRRKSLRRQNMRSMTLRAAYCASSKANGTLRVALLGMTTREPRWAALSRKDRAS